MVLSRDLISHGPGSQKLFGTAVLKGKYYLMGYRFLLTKAQHHSTLYLSCFAFKLHFWGFCSLTQSFEFLGLVLYNVELF